MENAVCIAEIDGSANPNPGPGGWGVYLEGPGIRKEIHGALSYTTNNLAEYRAFLEAVRLAKDLGIKKIACAYRQSACVQPISWALEGV